MLESQPPQPQPPSQPNGRPAGGAPTYGVLAAMGPELGPFGRGGRRRRVLDLELIEQAAGEARVLAVAGGVGKVLAARAAAVLLMEAPLDGLFVVGVCGALRAHLKVGTLVHCQRAVQADLAVREGREVASDAGLRRAWRTQVQGPEGWFVTADRPVLTPWRRLRLARAFAGAAVADMETAAAAAVSHRAGVPWAALRAVTDGAGFGAAFAFQRHFPIQAGRAAESLWALLEGPGSPQPAAGALSSKD